MIKAIDTIYNGYRFRSRLEARWAVFFDTLGIKYEYEKEGFDMDGVLYLPDFWLPKQNCWVEIKGGYPKLEEELKCAMLAIKSKFPCYLFYGSIPLTEQLINWESGRSADLHCIDGGMDSGYAWCECPNCKALDIEFDGRTTYIDCGCTTKKNKYYNLDSPRLLNAYNTARQARFEHGENRI